MMASKQYTDDELTAYLDHEIDAETDRLISRQLETDVALQVRVEKLNTLTNGISSALDGLLASAPNMPDIYETPTLSAARGWLVPVGLVAALTVGIACGGYMTQRAGPNTWMEYVSAYQALYVSGTLTAVDISQEDKTAQLAQLGEVLGRDLSAIQNSETIEFRRAQLLGYQGKPLVQMAFLSPMGSPIALCVIQLDSQTETAPQHTHFEGMSAAYWSKNGYSYLLIGGQDDGLIEREAKNFFDLI